MDSSVLVKNTLTNEHSAHTTVHPSSVVEPGAIVHPSVRIGPFCIVGKGVSLDQGCELISHVVIKGDTKIGKNNRFFQFGTIGEVPPDVKYNGEATKLVIGDNNIFREAVTIHLGTIQDKGLTSIGNDNLFLAYTHVAHDCQVGNRNIFSHNATLAGHVKVGNHVNFGGFAKVSPYCTINDFAYISGDCNITKDIPCYIKVAREPERPAGLNRVGMQRAGIDAQDIDLVKQAYRLLYMKKYTTAEALDALHKLNIHQNDHLSRLIHSVEGSNKGIIR